MNFKQFLAQVLMKQLTIVYVVYFCRLFSEPDILVLDSPESCSKTRPVQLMEATVTAVPDRCGERCVVKLNILMRIGGVNGSLQYV